MSTSECTTKRCSKCGNEFPLTSQHFYRNSKGAGGFGSRCKTCHIETTKRWYENNHDKCKQDKKKYYEGNKDRWRRYSKKYRENNPGKVADRIRKWRDENKERIQEYSRVYGKENTAQRLLNEQRRRARKLGAGGTHTIEEVYDLYDKQRGLCFHCGKDLSISGYHQDHWIPISKGGTDDIGNIRLLCPFCNHSKHDKMPHEWHDRYHE